MRSYRIIYIIIPAILLLSCNKENLRPLFEVESVTSFTIPAGLNTVETHYFPIRNLTSSLAAQLETRNLTLDDISVIKPQTLVLTSLDPDVEFNFITSIISEMYTVNPDEGLEIYFREPVPINTKSDLVLFPSLLNVKDYISQSLFNIEMKLRVRTFINRDIDVRVDMVFQVQE